MRKITFGGATSVDNFIARSDGSVDWLHWTNEVSQITSEFWKTIDTVVMGRKTFEAALKLGSGTYPGVRNFVCSRTLTNAMGVAVVDDAVKLLRSEKLMPGKDICIVGGGDLARSLFEADLIDEIGFNVHPILLGTGVPAFHEIRMQIDLALVECRGLSNGCVFLKYRIKH